MPIFSLIIPVYNVESYIRKCLDSVFSQNFQDFEVCIVDDGSSDNSGIICKEYVNNYGSNIAIKLIHQSNQGVSAARNAALNIASGQYIWFIDADDYIDSNALKYINDVIQTSKCDTLFFGDKILTKYNTKIEYITDDRNKFLAENVCFCNPLMIFSRDIIYRNNLNFTVGIHMGEDLEFQYKYLLYCSYPVKIPYNFYHITLREGSASNNKFSERINYRDSIIILNNLTKYLQKIEISSNIWINNRIEERLKSYLHSCASLKECNAKNIKKELHNILNSLNRVGFHSSSSISLFIAKIDVGLYFTLFKFFKLLRKWL